MNLYNIKTMFDYKLKIITCVLQGEKPAVDVEVYFNAKKGGA